jgi:hypothetical protein
MSDTPHYTYEQTTEQPTMHTKINILITFYLIVGLFGIDPLIYGSAHTTKICATTNPNNNTVTFYACSSHNQTTVWGGLYVGGQVYNFSQVVAHISSTIPQTATCVGCGDNEPLRRCQIVRVDGLHDGTHTVTTTCRSNYECPSCGFPRMTLSGIASNLCAGDSDPPCVTCIKSLTLYADSACRAYMPDLRNKTFSCDRCSSTSITQSVGVGSMLLLGNRNVTMTATDRSNNRGSCQTLVRVVDNTPPVLTMSADPALLWPPNHIMVDVTIRFSQTDNCPQSVGTGVQRITHVVVDDADLGSGQTAVDWQIVSNNVVRLRAERAGTGVGRKYYVVGYVVDANGNGVSASTIVTVPHDSSFP